MIPAARADLGIVVADPTDLGSSRYTSAGHSLVYLSGVCSASPVHARLCQPGEQGSIVTMYPNFNEAQPYNWNIVPLSLYLSGSLSPGGRLLYGSPSIKEALELHAREHLLQPVCPGTDCPQLPHSYWRDLVAATVDRDLFLYAVRTTPAQDQIAVDWLNRGLNVNRYNPVTSNCADFAASLVNAIFPHSVHRDLLNDVGMMTPKAAARSFTTWALRHPELGFYSIHFAQQPGDVRRSGLARSGTETVIHTKKYLIPAIVFGDWELPTSIFASYIFTGRFSLYNTSMQHTGVSASTAGAPAAALPNTISNTRQFSVTGTPEAWAAYRKRFSIIQNSSEARSLSIGSRPPQYATAAASIDPDGLPWLTPDPADPTRRVGLSSENLLFPASDPALAFQLMLVRVRYALTAKGRMRESLPEFRQDWALLERAQSRLKSLQQPEVSPPAIAISPDQLNSPQF